MKEKLGSPIEHEGFPGGSAVESPNSANGGDAGSVPGSGRSSGERYRNSLQYSSLRNPMDREAWWATVYRREESDMT